jgi:hypothetical protein
MQQNLHVWCNFPNQQECVELKDDLCLNFLTGVIEMVK